MKPKQILSLLLAGCLLGLSTACAHRAAVEESPSQPETVQEVQPDPVEEEPVSPPQPEPAPEEPLAADEPQPEEEPVSQPEEPAALASVSVDAAALSALDGTKLGWGPGGPVDGDNRPSGATAYQEKYGQYDADFIRENDRTIYLTFDEGYENGYTAQILDVLKEKQVPAVFFVTMPYAESNPDLIQRMIDEGHTVGNHSVNHPSFPDTPLDQCKDEVAGLHDYIQEEYGYTMQLFRFPMGEFCEQDLKLLQEMGYRSVFWSFAYRDWLVDDQPDPAQALETICSKAHPGAIYLLHAVSQTNTQILGQVIDRLRAEGYEFAAYPA